MHIGTRRQEGKGLDQWHRDELVGQPAWRQRDRWLRLDTTRCPAPRVAARGPGQPSQRMLRFATRGVAERRGPRTIITSLSPFFLPLYKITIVTGWVSLQYFFCSMGKWKRRAEEVTNFIPLRQMIRNINSFLYICRHSSFFSYAGLSLKHECWCFLGLILF